MATFNKINSFVLDVASGVHQLQTGTTHVFKVALTNTAPVATNTILANITQVANGNGYATGGISCGTVTGAQASGTFKFTLGTDPVWTAAGGTIGPFRYAVLYNDTPTSPADPLIGWWDYLSSVTLAIASSLANTDSTCRAIAVDRQVRPALSIAEDRRDFASAPCFSGTMACQPFMPAWKWTGAARRGQRAGDPRHRA